MAQRASRQRAQEGGREDVRLEDGVLLRVLEAARKVSPRALRRYLLERRWRAGLDPAEEESSRPTTTKRAPRGAKGKGKR